MIHYSIIQHPDFFVNSQSPKKRLSFSQKNAPVKHKFSKNYKAKFFFQKIRFFVQLYHNYIMYKYCSLIQILNIHMTFFNTQQMQTKYFPAALVFFNERWYNVK